MNIKAFAELFESYCANYGYKETPSSIARPLSFLHFDMEDLTGSVRSSTFPAFFLNTPEVDFGGDNADSISESFEGSYMVLLPLANNDINDKARVVSEAKDICDNFIRRLMHDSRESELLYGFNVNGIKAGIVSRTVDSLYGWTVSFNIEQGFDGQLRTDIWEDLD